MSATVAISRADHKDRAEMTRDRIESGGASVLLGFRAENVRSFRDEMVFSMVATTLAEPHTRRAVP